MVKGIPIIGHEGPWGMWMQGCTYLCRLYTATALGKVECLVLRSAAFTPRYSFYRRLSGPQEQSGYEGVKEISAPPTLGIEPGPSRP